MAHNINRVGNFDSCYTVGALPWHALGQNDEKEINNREYIAKQSGTDWDVLQVKMQYPFNGDVLQSDVFGNIRSDNGALLGIVTERYEVLQNSELLDLAQIIRDTNTCTWDTAGALGKGERIWYGLVFNEESEIVKNDLINRHVLLTNSHDGKSRVRAFITGTRVVCQNTMNIALGRSTNGTTLSHYRNLRDNFDEVKKTLSLIDDSFKKYDEKMKFLATKNVSKKKFGEYTRVLVDDLFGKPTDHIGLLDKILDEKISDKGLLETIMKEPQYSRAEKNKVTDFFNIVGNFDDPTNMTEGVARTGYAALNAVTQWTNHQQAYRGNDKQRAESRFSSVLNGKADEINQMALKLALDTF